MNLGNFPCAQSELEEAKRIYDEHSNSRCPFVLIQNLGVVYSLNLSYLKAAECFVQAICLSWRDDDKEMLKNMARKSYENSEQSQHKTFETWFAERMKEASTQ